MQDLELSPADLAGKLSVEEMRLGELSIGDRSVRASLAVSYERLAPQTIHVLQAMSFMPGSSLCEATIAAACRLSAAEVRATVSELCVQQLVQEDHVGDTIRFRLHDLVRLYVRERADFAQHRENLRHLVNWYADGAADAAVHMGRTEGIAPRQIQSTAPPVFAGLEAALRWLDAEHECLTEAVTLADQQGWHNECWQLARWLVYFFRHRNHLGDWRATCEIGLQAAVTAGDDIGELQIRGVLGHVLQALGHEGPAVEHIERAIVISRELGEHLLTAHNLCRLGMIDDMGPDGLARSNRRNLEALKLYDGHPSFIAIPLMNLACNAGEAGDYQSADDYFQQALQAGLAVSDWQVVCFIHFNIADIAVQRGQPQAAIEPARESIAIAERLGFTARIARGWHILGTALQHSDPVAARDAWHRALAIYDASADPHAAEVRTLIAGLPKLP